MTISEKTFAAIKEQKITPKPRWEFILKDSVVWVMFSLALIVEGMLVSVTIFLFSDQDWDIYNKLDKNIVEYALIIVPYFWLVLMAIFCGLAWLNFRQTKKGYRFHTYLVVLVSGVSGLILGTTFFYFGLGNKIDQLFTAKVPYYERMVCHKSEFWEQPKLGLLAGEIVLWDGPDRFVIKDFDNGNEWIVTGAQVIWREPYQPGPPGPRRKIKLIGSQINDNTFRVLEVRPWQ